MCHWPLLPQLLLCLLHALLLTLASVAAAAADADHWALLFRLMHPQGCLVLAPTAVQQVVNPGAPGVSLQGLAAGTLPGCCCSLLGLHTCCRCQ
jgi:hypothetical protein